MLVLMLIESLFITMSNAVSKKMYNVNYLQCFVMRFIQTHAWRHTQFGKCFALIYRLTELDVSVSHITWNAFNTVLRTVITYARWLLTLQNEWPHTHTHKLKDTNKRKKITSGLSSPLPSLALSSQIFLVKSRDPLTHLTASTSSTLT